MKTFKWTIPEAERSSAEQRSHQAYRRRMGQPLRTSTDIVSELEGLAGLSEKEKRKIKAYLRGSGPNLYAGILHVLLGTFFMYVYWDSAAVVHSVTSPEEHYVGIVFLGMILVLSGLLQFSRASAGRTVRLLVEKLNAVQADDG